MLNVTSIVCYLIIEGKSEDILLQGLHEDQQGGIENDLRRHHNV